MVEQKIKELFNTKTILHIDNPEHYDLIMPHTTLHNRYKIDVNRGNFCINFETSSNYYATLEWYKKNLEYENYKFITSTELIGNTIYELW